MTLRNYKASSSFKMALLFTILLGIVLIALSYQFYINYEMLIDNPNMLIVLVICMLLMLAVIGTSFFISIYVVSRINHIAGIATKIMETGDLSKRIDISTKWDDLSALASILNDLFARVDDLMIGVRQVSDNIAHDLRTPLTRMRNQLYELDKSIDKVNKPKVEQILQEADRLLDTFKALQRISNIEKGKNIIEYQQVDLAELISDVIDLYEPLLEEKNIELKSELHALALSGDKNLLFQAFANILDNAMKFTATNGRIDIETYTRRDSGIIEIADTGIGMNHTDKEQVFKRFFRANNSRHKTGNGLGMSLVKAIIDLHHGTIDLQDNTPCGLKVHVQLPLA